MFWILIFVALAVSLFLLRGEGAGQDYRAREVRFYEQQRRAEARREGDHRRILHG